MFFVFSMKINFTTATKAIETEIEIESMWGRSGMEVAEISSLEKQG